MLSVFFSNFFGGFGFHFGQADGGGPHEIPRGGTITMDLDVKLSHTVVLILFPT